MIEQKRPNHRPEKERIIGDPLEREFYTIQEVADLLHFHHNTVRRMIKSGQLKATRFGTSKNGGKWRINRKDLEEFTRPNNVL